MKIVVVKRTEQASLAIAQLINEHMAQNEKILWLISGGSSIPIATQAARLIQNSDNLLLTTLVDDIYGVDEVDTNWHKLRAQGSRLNAEPILQLNKSLEETGEHFSNKLGDYLKEVDFAIGQFGIGDGYHTGGIQPGSVATAPTDELAIGYRDGKTARVTVTPALISCLDVAFVNSFGRAKLELVRHFLKSNASVVDEPTQALKQAKNTYLYTDVIQ